MNLLQLVKSLCKVLPWRIFVTAFPLEYVAEIYESLITTPRRNLQLIEEELKQVVPDPMHSMLEKQSKDDAIRKHNERKNKEAVICPPTCSGKMSWQCNTRSRFFINIFIQTLKHCTEFEAGKQVFRSNIFYSNLYEKKISFSCNFTWLSPDYLQKLKCKPC